MCCGSSIDVVLQIPDNWKEQSARRPLKYFIPDWDDRVDPDYDFVREERRNAGGWAGEVFAHQIYGHPCYDGVLVSREVIEKSAAKRQLLERLIPEGGIHRYLRLPPDFPVMGDCGAFGYAAADRPPYTTDDVLDYYTRLGFTYGVSVDHLVPFAKSIEEARFRYELTLENAREFLKEHRARGLNWEPVGAVQGWDALSYREAARQTVAMGYRYIALGGLVRRRSGELLRIVQAVRDVVPEQVRIHLFGIARPEITPHLLQLKIASIDSASPLRSAWLDARNNYWTLSGKKYAALRVPDATRSNHSPAQQRKVQALEDRLLSTLRDFDQRKGDPKEVLSLLADYHHLTQPGRKFMADAYRETLEDRPWKQCPCRICNQWGIEVIIFRGNNRNRRRGFHNTYVFYHQLEAWMSREILASTGYQGVLAL